MSSELQEIDTAPPTTREALFLEHSRSVDPELALSISKVMGELQSIGKDKENQAQHYAFASETAIANTLRPLMAKYGLSLMPFSIDIVKSDQVETKSSVLNRSLISATYRLSHKGGGCVMLTVPGEGMDSLDKSIQKAMTAAYKYALIETFCAGRGDDGDEGAGYEGGRATTHPSTTPTTASTKHVPSPHQGKDIGGYIMEFGKFKDQSIRNCDTEYLKWLLEATNLAIGDPAKKNFKLKNQKLVDIILLEIQRRAANARENVDPASDDEPPF